MFVLKSRIELADNDHSIRLHGNQIGPSICPVQQTLFALVLFSFSLSTANAVAQKMPAKYCGVWKVVSATMDGVEQTIPEGPEDRGNDFDLIEFIIQGNRMIQVRCNGEALVCKTKVLGAVRGRNGQALLKMDFWQIHRSDEEHVHALMSANDDRLTIAFFPPDTNATEISDDAVDCLGVIKMERRSADD